MTTIYLMRHSIALKNINNDYNNDSLQLQNEKMPLSIEGEELASNISKEEELQSIDVVISSNYVRAMSTAKYISNANNVNLIVNSAFGERKFGINSWDELPSDFGLRQNNDENYKVGDGESQKEVRERVYKALMDVIDKYKDKRIVIVSHGSAILWLLKQWCDIDLKNKCIIFNDKLILYDNIFNCTTFNGKFIKKLRKDNNLTQDELAKKLGVTYQAVSKWENGKSIPDIAILKTISELFNVNIDELLEGSVKNKKKLNKKIFIPITVLGICVVLIFVFFVVHKETYEFKVLETDSNDFDVSGVLAFSPDKSSIYISSIDYNNSDDDTEYKSLSCNLYDVNGDAKTKISSCESENSDVETLNELLNSIDFTVDDYASSCRLFKTNQLVLEIKAISVDDKTVTYEVPLSFDDDCLDSTNS